MSASRLILLIGVVILVLAAFGVSPSALSDVDLFIFGVAVCFSAGLV